MEKILKRVYENKRFCTALSAVSHAAVAISGMLFLYIIIKAYTISVTAVIKAALILAIPFIAISATRIIINAPKKKRGGSFPSRHAFSAFAISVFAVIINPLFGCIGLIFSLALCISRVLLGIHFIRDVLTGALCGVVSSILGVLITKPF